MGVIFDLDQTLVDSSAAETLRRQRAWHAVYRLIPDFTIYPGIPELLAEIREWGIPCAIVTSSPRPYCCRVVNEHRLGVTHLVCYHDTARRKPHPDPIRKALQQLGLDRDDAIAVGDEPKDIDAARACGVTSVAALWGAADTTVLLAARPGMVAATVGDLRAILAERFGP